MSPEMEEGLRNENLKKRKSADTSTSIPFPIPRLQSFQEPQIHNPFVHELNLPWYEWLKIVAMSVTIAPIRLVLFSFIMGTAWIISFIGTYGLDIMEDQPMSLWRVRMADLLRHVARFAFFVAGFHWIKIKGDRSLMKNAGIMVVAPHSSYLDTIIMFACNSFPMPISRQESVSQPFVGRLLRMTQPICVNREDPGSRQRTVAEIKRRARGREEGWPIVCLFPEGTTTNRSCLINFKLGAFLPGVPVQPIILRWPNRVDWITWTWQGHSALAGIWLGLCQFQTFVEIELLPVHYPNEDECDDPQLFANNVRKEMAENLELPMTDHSFEDCRLMMLAKKHCLPMACGIVEFSKLSRKLNLSYDSISQMLERFTSVAANVHSSTPRRQNVLDSLKSASKVKLHPTSITFDEFAEHLDLVPSRALKRVFDMYDRNKSGTIDFREYVIGLSLISSPANTEETIKTAFHLFDTEGKGYVTRDDLAKILRSAFSMTESQSNDLFDKIDKEKSKQINFETFSAYADAHPEYAKLFTIYMNFEEERTSQYASGERKKEQ